MKLQCDIEELGFEFDDEGDDTSFCSPTRIRTVYKECIKLRKSKK